MTVPTPANAASDATAELFETGVADLRVPEASSDTESLLLKVGVAFAGFGVFLIVLAWWNASGTKYVADQMPMLISGGLLGLAFIMVGLGLFIRFSIARVLRFWLARMVVEQQAQTDRIVEALARVEAAAAGTDAGPR